MNSALPDGHKDRMNTSSGARKCMVGGEWKKGEGQIKDDRRLEVNNLFYQAWHITSISAN